MKIKQVLLDGGFYEVPVIERLKKLRVKYIIRADKSKKLNKRLERANKERGYRVPWTVNKRAETTLVAYYAKKKNSGKEEWHAWVTNVNACGRGIASDTCLSQRLSHIAKEDMENLQEEMGHRNWLQGERRLSGKYVLQELHSEGYVLIAGDLPLQSVGTDKPPA